MSPTVMVVRPGSDHFPILIQNHRRVFALIEVRALALFIDLIARRRQWMLHGVLQGAVVNAVPVSIFNLLLPVARVNR